MGPRREICGAFFREHHSVISKFLSLQHLNSYQKNRYYRRKLPKFTQKTCSITTQTALSVCHSETNSGASLYIGTYDDRRNKS